MASFGYVPVPWLGNFLEVSNGGGWGRRADSYFAKKKGAKDDGKAKHHMSLTGRLPQWQMTLRSTLTLGAEAREELSNSVQS